MQIVVGPTKNAIFAEGDDWEWKKPFQDLKKSVIRTEDKWHILLQVDEDEKDEVHTLCDGRHRVESIHEMEEVGTQCESCMEIPFNGKCGCTHVEDYAKLIEEHPELSEDHADATGP